MCRGPITPFITGRGTPCTIPSPLKQKKQPNGMFFFSDVSCQDFEHLLLRVVSLVVVDESPVWGGVYETELSCKKKVGRNRQSGRWVFQWLFESQILSTCFMYTLEI